MLDDRSERDWLAGLDVRWMTAVLTDGTEAWRHRLGASDRALRLFAVAVARSDPGWPRVRAAARQALTDCVRYHDAFPPPAAGADPDPPRALPRYRPVAAARPILPHKLAQYACLPDAGAAAYACVGCGVVDCGRRAAPAAKRRIAGLLHEVFGNPFDRPVLPRGPHAACPQCGGAAARKPVWCMCRGAGTVATPCPFVTPLVRAMATAIYADLAWGDLPILADALEDAGCPEEVAASAACAFCGGRGSFSTSGSHAECPRCRGAAGCGTGRVRAAVPNPLLAHLRGGGVHVRGCWALDAVLGRRH